MNPLTNVKNITKLNEVELASGLIHKKSWHNMYKESAWIFIGGLEYGLTEGDVITVFSQYGEVVNINLVRDKKSGKSKGYCFLCYANQKSTILAVDNLNGIKLCNRTIRVDHVMNYKPPKEDDRDDEITKMIKSQGCAPKLAETNEEDLFLSASDQSKKKKSKKEKKEKKKKKKKQKSNESDSEKNVPSLARVEVKKEKSDPGYDKYDTSVNKSLNKLDKQRHRERTKEQSYYENLPSLEKFKSRSDDAHHSAHNRYNKYRSDDRPMQEYSSKEHRVINKDGYASSSRKIKRPRSNSSSDSSSGFKETAKHKHKKTELNSESLTSKRQHKDENRGSSSSSNDTDSSSESSSDDDRHKTDHKNTRKDQSNSYDSRRTFKESRDKYDSRNDSSDYSSNKSRNHSKTEKHSDYRYKYDSKYSDDCNHHRDHPKSKRDRR